MTLVLYMFICFIVSYRSFIVGYKISSKLMFSVVM